MSTLHLFLAVGVAAAFGGGVIASCLHADRGPAVIAPVTSPPLVAHGPIAQDSTPKEDLRLVPAEAYLRTYLRLFGDPNALAVQKNARENNLFDSWDDYFASLGFPDYKIDFPRGTQTNGLMLATFERLGIALCDRAVESDLKAKPPVPVEQRRIFAFDLPGGALSEDAFAPRFDILHRTFLGYPARLATTDRTKRFYALYTEIVSRHSAKDAPKSKFTPSELGWASVCYGLVRHPEFQLY